MRTALLMASLATLIAYGAAFADEGKDGKRRERPDGDRRAELIKKFDKDNSGDLDEEERAAARAAFAERRGEGDRRGGPQGRRGGDFRAEMLKKFDKDESGDLNEEERAALKKHFEEMRAKRGEGQRRPGQGRPAFDREKILAEFDKDKDGKLSEEERAAAKEAMKERFQKRRAEGGEKPRGLG